MTVTLRAEGTIALEGDCPPEDAEPLLQHLLADPAAEVDVARCERAHAAVLQVLMAAGRPVAPLALGRWRDEKELVLLAGGDEGTRSPAAR